MPKMKLGDSIHSATSTSGDASLDVTLIKMENEDDIYGATNPYHCWSFQKLVLT